MVAYAVSADDPSVFVKQPTDGDGTCVFTSCLNMFRRRAIIDEIKVMVWDSLTGMKPLCDSEVIPESEFITE